MHEQEEFPRFLVGKGIYLLKDTRNPISPGDPRVICHSRQLRTQQKKNPQLKLRTNL